MLGPGRGAGSDLMGVKFQFWGDGDPWRRAVVTVAQQRVVRNATERRA